MASTTAYTNYAILHSEQAFPRSYSRMSWGAVLAGTAVAVAISFSLSVVGLAIGFSVMQITSGAGIWMILSTMISMAAGGYVAGRLAGTFSHLDSELHGLTVWALTALLTAILLVRLVTAEIFATSHGAGSAAGGAIANESEFAGVPSGLRLIDRLQQSLSTGGDPAFMTREQSTAEIELLINRRLANGSFAPAERDRLIALLTHRDGLTHDEAALRIARMEQEADSVAARARTEEENAARIAQIAARGVSASLLLGLAAALLGAWFGTRHIRSIAVERVG
jgi:hypothetical protein